MASLTLSEAECLEYASLELPTYSIQPWRGYYRFIQPDFVFRSENTKKMLTNFFNYSYIEAILNFEIIVGSKFSAVTLPTFKIFQSTRDIAIFSTPQERGVLKKIIDNHKNDIMSKDFLLLLSQDSLNYIQYGFIRDCCFMDQIEENKKHDIFITMKVPIEDLAKISKIIIRSKN